MTDLAANTRRGLLERLFAVDRAEHSVGVRMMLGLPVPLLTLGLATALPAVGPATMWFAASTAVFLSGWLGGFVSGCVATLVAAVGIHQWLVPAHVGHAWGASETIQFTGFVAAGLLVSMLHGRLRATVRMLDQRRIDARTHARQLDETRALLQSAQARLALALDSANIGFWRWDFATGRVEWDHSVRGWFELREPSATPLTYDHWVSRLHPDDKQRALAMVEQARRDGQAQLVDYRLRLPSGSERHLRSSGVVEHDAAGHPIAMIGIHQDVTQEAIAARELRAREREVQALNRQLEERVVERTAALLDALLHAEAATQAKAAFLRNISHELRTPLNPILGFSQLLAQSITDPVQQEHLQHISAGGRRLLALVTNLIELTRTANEKTSRTAVDLAATLDAAIATFATQAAEKRLSVEAHVDPAIPAGLSGDPIRVSQVLMQLLSNAIKFSERGGIQVRALLLTAAPASARVRFEVRDQGNGIEPALQRHIFDVFRQGYGARTGPSGGLGIGLALAKRAVEHMGGEIGVESEPDAGSTVWFTLEFDLEPSASAPAQERLFG